MQSVGMIAFVLNYTNITCILVQSVGMIVFDLNYTNVSHTCIPVFMKMCVCFFVVSERGYTYHDVCLL